MQHNVLDLISGIRPVRALPRLFSTVRDRLMELVSRNTVNHEQVKYNLPCVLSVPYCCFPDRFAGPGSIFVVLVATSTRREFIVYLCALHIPSSMWCTGVASIFFPSRWGLLLRV